jgi:hypothetical protein
MNTADLTGAALAYWVHKANGTLDECMGNPTFAEWMEFAEATDGDSPLPLDWATCGPIIERDMIGCRLVTIGGVMAGTPETIAYACSVGGGAESFGPTYLIAAMRAKVASVYGEEVPDL